MFLTVVNHNQTHPESRISIFDRCKLSISLKYGAVILLKKQPVQLLLQNVHIHRFVNHAEDIEAKGFAKQDLARRAGQQNTRQQRIIHSNNPYGRQCVGLLRVHIDYGRMDSLSLDNIHKLCRSLSDKQIHTPGLKYAPEGFRPCPVCMTGQDINFLEF
jgi:hypothetical protein